MAVHGLSVRLHVHNDCYIGSLQRKSINKMCVTRVHCVPGLSTDCETPHEFGFSRFITGKSKDHRLMFAPNAICKSGPRKAKG